MPTIKENLGYLIFTYRRVFHNTRQLTRTPPQRHSGPQGRGGVHKCLSSTFLEKHLIPIRTRATVLEGEASFVHISEVSLRLEPAYLRLVKNICTHV